MTLLRNHVWTTCDAAATKVVPLLPTCGFQPTNIAFPWTLAGLSADHADLVLNFLNPLSSNDPLTFENRRMIFHLSDSVWQVHQALLDVLERYPIAFGLKRILDRRTLPCSMLAFGAAVVSRHKPIAHINLELKFSQVEEKLKTMRSLPHCNNEELLDPRDNPISISFCASWMSQKHSIVAAAGSDIEKKQEEDNNNDDGDSDNEDDPDEEKSVPLALSVKNAFKNFSPLPGPSTPPLFPGPEGVALKNIVIALGRAMRLDGAEVDSLDHAGNFIHNVMAA